jgi:hypothetical protein
MHGHTHAATATDSSDPAVNSSVRIGSDSYIYQIERNASTAREVIDELLPLAQQGDAAATHALRRLMNRCINFVGSPRARAKVTAPEFSEDAIWQAKVIELGSRYCDDARLYDTEGFFDQVRASMRRLREHGDEIAIAESLYLDVQTGQLPDPRAVAFSRAEAWRLIRQSNNPYAIEEAMTVLASLPEDFQGATGRLAMEAIEQFSGEHAYLRTLAAWWMACELGADCRPYGRWQQNACLHQRNCAPNLGLQDFIRLRMLTPPQFAAMQRYLNVIRAERARG